VGKSVTCHASPPAVGIAQIWGSPLRVDRKAIVWPSGLQRAWKSFAPPGFVKGFAWTASCTLSK
jgi:hypothetical protein